MIVEKKTQNELFNIVQDILNIESQSILNLQKNISEEFFQICYELCNTKGKVILCGIGKSGHVGKKISATLASTGTPAFFVHPAEAFHGDLGMIQPEDNLILISNSGESSEITSLIKPLLKRNISFFAMTGNVNSTLAINSKGILNISIKEEGCPLGLAPFASTTTTMAMGDIISGILMTLKNFKSEDFAMYHPGGALGKKLLSNVDDYMKTESLPFVAKKSPFIEIVNTITSGQSGCCIVVDEEGKLEGIITDSDLRRSLSSNKYKQRFDFIALDIMSSNPHCVLNNTKLDIALSNMKNKKIHNLIVVNDKKQVIGLLNT